ncbi:MAG TPA: hypothetical protein VD947_04085 [Patescibacteria group bacterium]|nr:hypothetical protein [Patescibacteria group bacterium]
MENNKSNKAWYKKWWVWAIVIIVLIGIGGASSGKESSKPTADNESTVSSPEPASEPEKPKWDAAAAYDKVQTGMTKTQVETTVGQPSKNCSESSIEGYGTTESCNYTGGFGDKGTIIVIYSNGAVQSKSKIDF